MRRLTNSRSAHPDASSLEGFDPISLEGDLAAPAPDAIGSLRPFGRDIPEQRLVPAATPVAGDDEELIRIRALAERGRRLDAILALRKLLDADPARIGPRVELARQLADASEWEEAIEQLTLAIERAAEPAPILVRRGALYAQQGQPKEAERDFRDATRRDPSHWPAFRYLGITRLRLGAAGEAIGVLREALSLAPQDPESVLYLGEALLTQGQLDEAHETLERAVAMLPTDPRGYTLLGRLFDRLGMTDEAMGMHRKAREVATP